MEELFCIGCGIQIQTTRKQEAGFTPAAALAKGIEAREVYCQRCFRLRHYNDITDVHITDDEFLKLLHEVGDSDALVVNVVDIFDLMARLFLAYHALLLEMIYYWLEIKRIFFRSLLRTAR